MAKSMQDIFDEMKAVLSQPTDEPVSFSAITMIMESNRRFAELNRLADIGRATEKALEKGGWIQIPLEHDIDTTDDLLEWAKGGK